MQNLTFIVGEEPVQKTFLVNKKAFCVQCPAFRDLYCGVLQKYVIKLPNVDPDDFQLVVRHVNGKKVLIESMQHAWNVLNLAEKFEISNLTEMCRDYILGSINVYNACCIFEEAEYQEDENLILGSLNFLTSNAKQVIEASGLIGANMDTVAAIFRQNCVNIDSESQIFGTIIEWGKAECTLKQCASRNLRNIIEPLLPNIRFSLMDAYDFMREPELSKVFRQEEILDILMNQVWPGSSKLPIWCNADTTPRGGNCGFVETSWSNPCLCLASDKKYCMDANMTFQCKDKGLFLTGVGFMLSSDFRGFIQRCLAIISIRSDEKYHTTILEKHNVAMNMEQTVKFEAPFYVRSGREFQICVKLNSTSPPIHYCKMVLQEEDGPFNVVTQNVESNGEKLLENKFCFSSVSYLHL